MARAEFADKGLSGARIDEIAARTRTSKRMIYYYFGSKEGLYISVLEEAYRTIRNIERDVNVDHELAKEAGKKGGESVPDEKRSFSQDRELAREAGKKGGENSCGNR